MSYRAAVWGLPAGLVAFVLLLHRAGMSPWLATTFSFLFLLIPFVSTRLRTEDGILVHAYGFIAPRYMLVTALGTRRLGPRNLAALGICFFNRGYRAQQMPHQLEAFKMASERC